MNQKYPFKKLSELIEYDTKRNNKKNIPYVGLEDIQSNSGQFFGKRGSKEVKSTTYSFSSDHILYGRLRPYLNKVLLPDFEGHCSTEIIPIKTKNNINKKFFFYWITSFPVVEKINKTCTGARMPRANLNEILDLTISIPPLPEQQRIVDILDQSFNAINQAIKNTKIIKDSLKDHYESYLNEIFEDLENKWPSKKIIEVCIIRPPKNEAKLYINDTALVSFVPMEDLGINQKYLKPKKVKKLMDVYSGYTYFGENDVLLAKITPCFENGKLGIAHNLKNKTGFGSSEYMVFRPNKGLRSEFFYYFLSRKKFREIGKKYMQGAVGHKRVSLDFITNYPIPIPPLGQQDAIINKCDDFFEKSNSLILNYNHKLQLLQELKQSILHKAFNGNYEIV